jgi:hypothetical protein
VSGRKVAVEGPKVAVENNFKISREIYRKQYKVAKGYLSSLGSVVK